MSTVQIGVIVCSTYIRMGTIPAGFPVFLSQCMIASASAEPGRGRVSYIEQA